MRGEKKRRFLRTAALGLGLAVLAIFTVLPSAAAQAPQPTAGAAATSADIDLSNVPKIKSYLRSLGVNPRGVVIQRGAKNYAGPNCPGASWNCTTSRKVVQLSTNGDDGENRFACRRDKGAGTVSSDKTPPDQACTIVQPGGSSNSATCDIRTSGSTGTITQACFITQGGASNSAFARLVAVMGSKDGEQDVVQRIEIKQTGGASGNTLNADEIALLGAAANKGGAGVATRQDFHQVICGNQQAAGGGGNTATVNQYGAAATYHTNAGGVTIDQNTEFLASTCTTNPPGAGLFADISGGGHDPLLCPVVGGSGFPKQDANTCSRIQQESASGRNKIDRQNQTNLLFASVNGAASADIEQGTFSGGIESTQDQTSTGVSSIVDAQDADHVATVRNVPGFIDIRQIEDPRCCAGGHQLGNTGNTWTLGQDLSQRAFIDGVLVDPELFGQGFIVQQGADYGNCTTSGTCTVNQKVSNNVVSETNSDSGPVVDIFVECSAGSFGHFLRPASAAAIQQAGFCTTNNVITLRRAGPR